MCVCMYDVCVYILCTMIFFYLLTPSILYSCYTPLNDVQRVVEARKRDVIAARVLSRDCVFTSLPLPNVRPPPPPPPPPPPSSPPPPPPSLSRDSRRTYVRTRERLSTSATLSAVSFTFHICRWRHFRLTHAEYQLVSHLF